MSPAEGDLHIELAKVFHDTNSSAAVALTPDGSPATVLTQYLIDIAYGNNAMNSVFHASMKAHALSTGDLRLYEHHASQVSRPDIQIPDISQMKLVAELLQIPAYSPPTSAEIIDSIHDTAKMVSPLIDGKAELYSPIFSGMTKETQIPVTDQVRYLFTRFMNDVQAEDIQNSGGFNLSDEPQPVTVIHAISRLHLLPTELAANATPATDPTGNFDSGWCDALSLSSLNYGEEAFSVATYDDFSYVMSKNVAGWIRNTDIAHGTIRELPIFENHMYIGAEPLFFKDGYGKRQVILPGDTGFMYVPEHDYYFTCSRTPQGTLTFETLTTPNQCSGKFIKQFENANDMIQTVKTWNVPYMHSIMDCSNLVKRACRGLGIRLPKSTTDQMNLLKTVVPDYHTVTSMSGLHTMQDGLYLNFFVNPKTERSSHVGFYLKHGVTESFISQAFQLKNPSGSIDSPVGLHNGTNEVLETGLQQRTRTLLLIPIAR